VSLARVEERPALLEPAEDRIGHRTRIDPVVALLDLLLDPSHLRFPGLAHGYLRGSIGVAHPALDGFRRYSTQRPGYA
jgi:hypothetical protein